MTARVNKPIANFIFAISTLIIFPHNLNAQDNLFYMGSKTFISSPKFEIGNKNYSYCDASLSGNSITMYFAKDIGRTLVIFENNSENELICGTILFYLDDNSIITLIDRNIYDQVNSICTSVYYLTPAETERLKNTNIKRIRFSVDTYFAGNKFNQPNAVTVDNVNASYTFRVLGKPLGDPTNIYRTDVPQILNDLLN